MQIGPYKLIDTRKVAVAPKGNLVDAAMALINNSADPEKSLYLIVRRATKGKRHLHDNPAKKHTARMAGGGE